MSLQSDPLQRLNHLAKQLASDFSSSRASRTSVAALCSLLPGLKYYSIAVVGTQGNAMIASSVKAQSGPITLTLHTAAGSAAGLAAQGKGIQASLEGPSSALLLNLSDIQTMVTEAPACRSILSLPITGGGIDGALLLGFSALLSGLSQRRLAGLSALCRLLSDTLVDRADEVVCMVEQMIGCHLGCVVCTNLFSDSDDDETEKENANGDPCKGDKPSRRDGDSQGALTLLAPIHEAAIDAEERAVVSENEEEDDDDDECDDGRNTSPAAALPTAPTVFIKSKLDSSTTADGAMIPPPSQPRATAEKPCCPSPKKKPLVAADGVPPCAHPQQQTQTNAQQRQQKRQTHPFTFSKASIMGVSEGALDEGVHPLWLTFPATALEEDFQNWHQLRMLPVDALFTCGVLVTLIAMWSKGLFGVTLGSAFQLQSLVMLPPVVVAGLALLHTDVYRKYREVLLGVLRIYIAVVAALLINPGEGGKSAVPSALQWWFAQGAIAVLTPSLGLHVRHCLNVPLQLLVVAAVLVRALPRSCVATAYFGSCGMTMGITAAIVGYALPVVVTRATELRARTTFAQQLHAMS